MRKYTYNIHNTDRNKDSVTFILLYSRPQERARFKGPKCLWQIDDDILLHKQIYEIQKLNIEKDIIVMSGCNFQKMFKEKQPNFKMIDNSNFDLTGSFDDVKNGILISSSNKIVFLSDNNFVTINILEKLVNKSSIVSSPLNELEYKNFIVEGKLIKIGFIGDTYFTGSFSLMDKELSLANQFIYKEYTKNKIIIESINYILENNGNFEVIYT